MKNEVFWSTSSHDKCLRTAFQQAFGLESSIQSVQMVMCVVSVPSQRTFILQAETVGKKQQQQQ